MFKQWIGFHYNVSNLERTLDFYTKKLGFTTHDYDANMRQVRLYSNTSNCLIGFAEMQPVVPGTTCITFEVEEVHQAVEFLKQKGVVFEGDVVEIPNVIKLASFTDPDGYKLMLYSQA